MASQFKNRLVGVTILVASIVIFLPSIIDGKKTAYEDEFIATPIKPKLQEHTFVNQSDQLASKVIISESEENNITSVATDKDLQSDVANEQWEIEEVAQTVTISTTKVVKESAKKTQPAPQKKPAKVAVPQSAWTIQLGAFQNAKNINILLKKLHKAGFQAHTVPTEVIDGELTRVFVGPDVSKKKLEKQLSHLKRLTQLQGKLIPFNAVNP